MNSQFVFSLDALREWFPHFVVLYLKFMFTKMNVYKMVIRLLIYQCKRLVNLFNCKCHLRAYDLYSFIRKLFQCDKTVFKNIVLKYGRGDQFKCVLHFVNNPCCFSCKGITKIITWWNYFFHYFLWNASIELIGIKTRYTVFNMQMRRG